ncbi:MAG: hypothetical protein IT438_11760 [Phycisphaerales bacterium]|nr:hypothetical protein [Phycisphaerales bacterium]
MPSRPTHAMLIVCTALTLGGGLGGCSGDGGSSGGAHVGAPHGGIFGTRRSPNAELTPDEGRKLLLEIQKDPKRMKKLTPPERRYLAKAGLVNKGELTER